MSKLRFFKASPIYAAYADKAYRDNPALRFEPYRQQYDVIMRQSFGWSDLWKHNLEAMGRYEAMEVITNAEHMQKQWAKENNISYSDENWLEEIVTAQVEAFQPDIFFVHDYVYLHTEFFKAIRKRVPGIQLLISWDGVANCNADFYEGCDIVMSCAQFIVDAYLAQGKHSLVFPFGFDERISGRLVKRPAPLYDASFVGSVPAHPGTLHSKRLHFLAEVARRIPYELWASGLPPVEQWQAAPYEGLTEAELADRDILIPMNKGELFGLEMYQALADSRISLNAHIDRSGKHTGNMRLYEATGVGSCLFTELTHDLPLIFEPDTEVVTYQTVDEAVDKLRYLLNNEQERRRIAEAGQKRTLTEYSYARRVQDCIAEIETVLSNGIPHARKTISPVMA